MRLAGKLIVVTGKGGVGKSALAAALTRRLARPAQPVLLLDADPRESCFRLLAVRPSGGDVVDAGGGASVQSVKARLVLDEIVREQLRLDPLVRRVLASPVYGHFVDAAPGLEELAVLGHALRALRGLAAGVTRPAQVILDAPASGHALALLRAPRLVADVVGQGPFAAMSRELAAMIDDAAATEVVLVTLAEEMPVQETIEAARGLESQLGRGPALVAANGLWPPLSAEESAGASADPDLQLWLDRRRVNDRHLDRLRAEYPGPLVELPLLPLDPGPRLVSELERRLAAAGIEP